jgi:aryl-alcohol dehydrogenase-like predicted oxidoreductase
MQRRQLGSSGLKVSLVGIGCNNFGSRLDLEAARKVVHKALDLGIDHFDTADIYGPGGASEKMLGEILASRRRDAVIATKCGKPMDKEGRLRGGSRRYIMAAVEDSLRRLKTDWIDLLYMHDPDPQTPIEESLRTLDDLVRQGKARYIACSNFAAWQVAEAHWAAREINTNAFAACQDEYNLLERAPEKELLPAIRACGLGLVPYFPLASGLLTGKYKRDAMPKGARLTEGAWFAKHHQVDKNWGKVEALRAFCKSREREMTELAFSWLAARPEVASIIGGATSAEQVEQNAKAAGWALGAADLQEIDRVMAAD